MRPSIRGQARQGACQAALACALLWGAGVVIGEERVATREPGRVRLLKLMLSPELPPPLRLTDIDGRTVNRPPVTLSELARRAGVSVGTAHRLAQHLRREHFCASRGPLVLMRRETLLDRWSALRPPHRELRTQFVLPPDEPMTKLGTALRTWAADSPSAVCLGLFAAAGAWGFGHVAGVPPMVYVRTLDEEALERLGLARVEDADTADVLLRQPAYPESTFRGSSVREDGPVTDLIQCWLDASAHAARGPELAALLYDALFGAGDVP